MLHLYALVRHPAVVPDVNGIEDRPLRSVAVDGVIDAVISDTSQGVNRSDDAVLAHARVVDALAESNEGILPARFAGSTASDDALRASIAGRSEQILAALERVDGCVELGLRVLRREEAAEAPATSGREYMLRRLDEVGQAEALSRDVHGKLAGLARESTCEVVARGDVVLTSAYLVPRDHVERFRAALHELERIFPAATLVLTGPWPPYSFTLLEAGGGT